MADTGPYRDFSHVTASDAVMMNVDVATAAPPPSVAAAASTATAASGVAAASAASVVPSSELYQNRNFPAQLHFTLGELEADGLAHIAAWQPHGRCFIVHKPDEFVEKVLNKWFRQTQYASFQRQLNIYGFNRITFGPDKGAYYSEFFLRGKPFLCHYMKRSKVKGSGPRRPSSPRSEPNFYAMPFLPSNSIDGQQQHTNGAIVTTTASSPAAASSLAQVGNVPLNHRNYAAAAPFGSTALDVLSNNQFVSTLSHPQVPIASSSIATTLALQNLLYQRDLMHLLALAPPPQVTQQQPAAAAPHHGLLGQAHSNNNNAYQELLRMSQEQEQNRILAAALLEEMRRGQR